MTVLHGFLSAGVPGCAATEVKGLASPPVCSAVAQPLQFQVMGCQKLVTVRGRCDSERLAFRRLAGVLDSTSRFVVCSIILTVLETVTLSGQHNPEGIGRRLLDDPPILAAVDVAGMLEAEVIADQIALCEIPAPPFGEQARAEAYHARFKALGLRHVRIDEAGNVLGERPGLASRPHLVFSAHLDTVFAEEVGVEITREGSILRGPGIGDNCRGLAVVLGVIRALDRAEVRTKGHITFVGTVGEEGLGDLRGVKHLFATELAGIVDRFVSVDGAGLDVTHVAVGSNRYRVTFRGPGGHSFGAFGLASPIHALGRLIDKIADFEVPAEPKTTFNVGRIRGGTSVNSIASGAWLEVDLRSEDPVALEALDARFQQAIGVALAEENSRWGRDWGGSLRVETEVVGKRPAGRTPTNAPLVRTAIDISETLRLPLQLAAGSTDANLPMSLGIPAITIDGGGQGSGTHSVDEAFDMTNSALGTQRATLLAIALTEP